MSVFKKLQDARIQLQSKKLKKSGQNKFAGFEYFELADFLSEIQSIFASVGLSSTTNFSATEAVLVVIDTETLTEARFTCPFVVPTMKGCNEIQAMGAAITYCRRYLYVNALEIVEHDAMDALVGKDEPKAKSVAADHWDMMPEDAKRRLQGVADAVIACIQADNMADAMKALSEVLSVEEKTALWSRLDSKQRASIKKYQSQENK